MSKYKVGDKVVLTVTSTNEMGCLPCYVLNDDLILSKQDIDKYAEPLSNYTEPLERKNENKQKQIEELVDKLHRQAAEITRLLASNAEIQGLNNTICDVCKSDEFLKETAESAKEEGQNEAWELAKKCMLMTDRERETIFGSGHNALYGVLTYFDYKHAAAKVAQWEKAKEEIKVGDEVEKNDLRDVRFIVTFTNGRLMNGVTQSGLVFANEKPKEWHKTGRHIDIDSFLKQIGGNGNER